MILFNAHRRSRVPPIVIGAVVGSRIKQFVSDHKSAAMNKAHNTEFFGSGRRALLAKITNKNLYTNIN
jgi:hypothetical protein